MSREQPTHDEYVREAVVLVILAIAILFAMWLRG